MDKFLPIDSPSRKTADESLIRYNGCSSSFSVSDAEPFDPDKYPTCSCGAKIEPGCHNVFWQNDKIQGVLCNDCFENSQTFGGSVKLPGTLAESHREMQQMTEKMENPVVKYQAAEFAKAKKEAEEALEAMAHPFRHFSKLFRRIFTNV